MSALFESGRYFLLYTILNAFWTLHCNISSFFSVSKSQLSCFERKFRIFIRNCLYYSCFSFSKSQRSNIGVFLYVSDIIVGDRSVEYSLPHSRPIRVSRSTSLLELIQVVHRMLNIDPLKFSVKLSTKYSFIEQSSWNEVVNIVDNDVLEFIMQCLNMQMLHLYVET